jgi:hypothetical protein
MIPIFEGSERIRIQVYRLHRLKPLREIFFESPCFRCIGSGPLENLIVMEVKLVVAHRSLPVD